MARVKAENPVVQSLLDRLTEYEDWPTTRNQSLTMYREGIKRDVEWLLNSRKPHLPILEGYKLAAASVINFGLPDLAQFNGANANPETVVSSILYTVRTYETRIRDPRVSLSRTEFLQRSLRFHVEGRLVFENAEEDISFDTVLEITSGEYNVK
jgi:type VI secretion system protein ImpF